jgi:UDP-N-acetylmuramyl pentapeptide phosphotransferase/UDP-N-acetylglucosamine-1-phosphate transferase
LLAWLFINLIQAPLSDPLVVIPACAFVLAVISWADDLNGLSPLTRLAAQTAAVTAALVFGPEQSPLFQGLLPMPVDTFVAGLLWVWFINLFNFMDGIDGITGIEAASIGIGIVLISGEVPGLYAIAIVGVTVGFLKWNWHPAKVFMGDVGSVPLGFLLGWLLLGMAADGYWVAALILPAYYLMDATTTLVRRALAGEKVWQAHREHFYQKAVQRGLSHATVSRAVLSLNSVLVVAAIMSTKGWAGPALILTVVLVALFLRWLAGSQGTRP